jgi:hypothetical protein
VRPAQLSSQSSCGMSVETGFVNKSVVLKTARPTRRWRILHRLGHRAALAATDGRAWTLRDCCWPRRRALFARPRELFSRNRPDPRTDLGRTRSGGTSSPFRRSDECAVPLLWAHSEYVKLHRSAADGRVFDLVEPAYERYVWRTGEHKNIEV